jgi:DNA polymerase elongation subunit (family B)
VHAANEVTRRGRETLELMCRELAARGVTLLEADTDGVYFTVPADWTEAQERAAVEAVAATLPASIRLEYEGRYQAMFSHEVKNYALLTYGDQLIVRGVAMRSSRSEPFGERFLRTALHCLMLGDLVGIRQVYQETCDALRHRTLTVADVAARVRLSKSSDEYATTRSRSREPQYEALLAAGRTRWSRGERVRFYRAQGGGYVWLPDEPDETAGNEGWEEGEGETETVVNRTGPENLDDRRDYDIDNYLQTLLTSYAGRLRKALAPEDFAQLFRLDQQPGLFDRPIEDMQPLWIRA